MLSLLRLKMKRKPFLGYVIAKSADSFLIPVIINWKICPNPCEIKFPSTIFINKHIRGGDKQPRAPQMLFPGVCVLETRVISLRSGIPGGWLSGFPSSLCTGQHFLRVGEAWDAGAPGRLVSGPTGATSYEKTSPSDLETSLVVKILEQWPGRWSAWDQRLPPHPRGSPS